MPNANVTRPTMRFTTVPSANQIAANHTVRPYRVEEDALEQHRRDHSADRAERERTGQRAREG